MNTTPTEVRYEDSAEVRTVTGFVCTVCQRFWGRDEHMARYCCATSLPCECGGRVTPRGYSACDACRKRKADARWAELLKSAVPWDGETPLCTWDDDRYFFSADEVADYLENLDNDREDESDPASTIESLRLVLCEPEDGPTFDMLDFLSDDIPDDDHGGHSLDTREIDKIVNDWIAAHAPFCWRSTQVPVTAESVRAAV